MKYQNFVFYLVIPLALFSIPSLLENAQAETNSTNQTQAETNSTNQISQQQNHNMNLIAQTLMKVNIFQIKDTLMNAKLAIVDGHFLEALTDVRDVETQLLLIELSPTKFLNDIHKAIYAIARSDIDKSLDTLTKIQLDIIKAENQIFKAAVANPQMMQQVKAAVTNPQMMQQFNTMESNTNEEEGSKDIEEGSKDIEEGSKDIEEGSKDIEEGSKDIEEGSKDIEEGSKDTRQQFNTMDTIINEEEYYTDIEDT